ncbi:prepilin peptidase [Paenibacillus solani]|uniref:prepilin peptidase n=1 Tax=Paenibacillus solani TaxID=1705565 RepID=UPI003D2AEF32
MLCIWFSYTDIRWRIIPNRITHPLIIALLFIRVFEPAYFLGLIPALILVVCFFVRPNSIGAGDIKFLAVIGLCYGIQGTLLVTLITCALVLVFSYLRKICRFKKLDMIPLAPFLSIGVLLSLAVHLLL